MAHAISILSYSILIHELNIKPLFRNNSLDENKKYKFIEYVKDGQEDSIFIAIQKKKQLIKKIINDTNTHNIHSFEQLLKSGCRAFIVDEYYYADTKFQEELDAFINKYQDSLDYVVIAKNSIELYYEIANIYRKKINPIVIAVTGSVGKTSTTEMLYSIFSQTYNVHKSNVYNTIIAISRAVINMPIDTQYLIIEVSSRKTGLMSINSKILEPNIAVITQIKYEHVKGMGSIDGIANEKLSITKFMNEDTLLICPNIELIKRNLDIKYKGDILLIGIECSKKIKTYINRSEFYYKNEKYTINTPGFHNIENAILSIETSLNVGIKANQISNGLSNYITVGNRWKVDNLKNNIVVINDSPNNPSHATVIASIDTLVNSYKGYKKIIVLSDILELGQYEQKLYEDIGAYIDKQEIYELILYGDKISKVQNKIKNKNIRVKHFNKIISTPINFRYKGKLTDYIGPLLSKKTVVLIKASRIMGFDKISKNIIQYVQENINEISN